MDGVSSAVCSDVLLLHCIEKTHAVLASLQCIDDMCACKIWHLYERVHGRLSYSAFLMQLNLFCLQQQMFSRRSDYSKIVVVDHGS